MESGVEMGGFGWGAKEGWIEVCGGEWGGWGIGSTERCVLLTLLVISHIKGDGAGEFVGSSSAGAGRWSWSWRRAVENLGRLCGDRPAQHP